jgi:hypothetical protein
LHGTNFGYVRWQAELGNDYFYNGSYSYQVALTPEPMMALTAAVRSSRDYNDSPAVLVVDNWKRYRSYKLRWSGQWIAERLNDDCFLLVLPGPLSKNCNVRRWFDAIGAIQEESKRILRMIPEQVFDHNSRHLQRARLDTLLLQQTITSGNGEPSRMAGLTHSTWRIGRN